MTPTSKLRFIEIRTPVHPLYRDENGKPAFEIYRILQQWWEKKEWAHDTEIEVDGEWRDVPLEKNP
jgi:hypothetical protein